MVGHVRASYECNDVFGVELPIGVGLFGIIEQGFSKRTGAASFGVKLIL